MSLFNLITSEEQLPRVHHARPKYSVVNSTTDCRGSNFVKNGQIRFRYTTGGNTWIDPKRCYFRLRVRLEPKTAEAPATDLKEKIAPSYNMAACCFQNIETQINGVVVHRQSEFLTECDTLDKRIYNSGAWNSTIGEGTMMLIPAFTERKTFLDNNKTFDIIWRPQGGIFDLEQGIPSGVNITVSLSPYNESSLYQRVVECSDTARSAIHGQDFDFTVEDFTLNMAEVDGVPIQEGSVYYNLSQLNCLVDTVSTSSTGSQQKVFDVKPSSNALILAFSDSRIGADNRYSPSLFKINSRGSGTTELEKYLERYFVNYASLNKPSVDYNAKYDPTTKANPDYAYGNNLIESGAYFDTGGAEKIKDFQDHLGRYYYHSFQKAGNDRSTRVSTQFQFQQAVPNGRVMLFDYSRGVMKIDFRNSVCIGVQTQDV